MGSTKRLMLALWARDHDAVVGAYDRSAHEFHAQEMRWDDIDSWTPCRVR